MNQALANTGSGLYIEFVLPHMPFKSSSQTEKDTTSVHPHTNISTVHTQYSIFTSKLSHNKSLPSTQSHADDAAPEISAASLQLTKPPWNEGFGGFQVSHL